MPRKKRSKQSLAMPDASVSRTNMVCNIPDPVAYMDTMNIIREVISNIDCNPPWVSGGPKPRSEWIKQVAERATAGLRVDNPVRGAYRGRKIYDDIVIDTDIVECVIEWFNGIYDVDISSYERVENVPLCPACGAHYELMWNRVNNCDSNTLYRLIWGCPSYKKACADAKRVFKRLSPEVMYMDGFYKVFFHDYIKDGNPIPREYVKQPVTEWTLYAESSLQTILPGSEAAKPKKVGRPSKKKANFTIDHINTIRRTFETRGPAGFFEAFPDERGISWNDVIEVAAQMGLAPCVVGL